MLRTLLGNRLTWLAPLAAIAGCSTLVGVDYEYVLDDTGGGAGDSEPSCETSSDCSKGQCLVEGECVCPPERFQCAGVCTSRSSDAKNCGSCGHDCMGGGCADGRCLPVLLFDTSGDGDHLALSPTHVYWSHSNGVGAVPKAGGEAIMFDNDYFTAGDVAVDATRVYWPVFGGQMHSIKRAPIVGGSPTVIVSVDDNSTGIAIDDTTIYWGDYSSGHVHSVSKAGGSVGTLATGQGWITDIEEDENNIYWGMANGISKIAKGGGAVSVLTTEGAFALTTYSNNLYWTSYTGNSVYRLPVGGGDVQILASEQSGAKDIAVDATGVYWTCNYSGVVMRASHDGSGAAIIAAEQSYPDGIITDEEAVYWTTANGIMKLSKPALP